MILGTGIDVIEVARIKAAIDRHERHFLDHVFTEEEQQNAPRGRGRYAFFAGRWAAKEAVAKALGTGIGADCPWKGIVVRSDRAGKPLAVLTGNALKTSRKLGIRRLHVSISHERNLACASAVAEN